MKSFSLFLIILLLSQSSFSKILSFKFYSTQNEDDIIATIKEDNQSKLIDAINKLNKIGGIIYIDTPVINIDAITRITLNGYTSGGLVGVKQPNGEYPRIDFSKRKEKMKSFSYVLSGIYIIGSHKYIMNLIIENSNSHGIEINHNYNTIDHVITRYNSGSGIYIDGSSNTLNYCYSYRNCDKTLQNEYQKDTDGFTFDAYNINMNNCYSWDNLGYGYKMHILSKLSLTHSASWNNGNPNVFTGKYDYDKRSPLDKQMETIKDLMSSDPNFENNYNSQNFNLDKCKINNLEVKEWLYKASIKKADGYGFSTDALTKEIKLEYNVAFDNINIGFNDLYIQKCPASVVDCVSFDNEKNYHLNYKYTKWGNNWGWCTEHEEQVDDNVKKPQNIKHVNKAFNSVKELIIKAVNCNNFPDNINFDEVINKLNE